MQMGWASSGQLESLWALQTLGSCSPTVLTNKEFKDLQL